MNSPKLTRLFTTAAVVGALSVPALADGHEEEGIFIPGASAEVTLDYVTNYFFRGFEQVDADQGIVLQPGASFTIDVVEDVTATVGTWGSIHTDAPSSTANPSSWYEQDIYGSIDATMGAFSAGVGFTYYTFPSSAVNGDITELNLSLGFDDSDLLGDFAFAPYVAVAIELQNNVGDENIYLELGGEFSLPTEGTAIEAWTWSVPFAFGLSIDTYYVDASGAEEFFGYASVGLVGSIPMSELIGTDEFVGAWDLSVGVTFLFLNSDVAGLFPTSTGLVDNADDNSDNFQVYATVGISRSW
ncbi:MAG: hypothetical protein AAGB26_06230 [Planctomycetota bacterium]